VIVSIDRIGMLPLAVIAAAALALGAVHTTAAETPTPNPSAGSCPGMMNVIDGPKDDSLSISAFGGIELASDGLFLEWAVVGDSNCTWIQRKGPGEEYPSSATYVFEPLVTTQTFDLPVSSGETCFRLFAVSDLGRSEPAEVCLEVDLTQLPEVPGENTGPTFPSFPTPAPTPWPVPTGVKIISRSVLLDANNFPLPPDKQVHHAGIEWQVLAGFTGTYEVEHSLVLLGSGQARIFTKAHTTPINASDAVGGLLRFEEQIDPHRNAYCYLVRTLINGETGPFSEPLCLPVPPGLNRPPVTPLPPDAGNGAAPEERSPALPVAILIAASLVLGAGVVGSLRRR